MADLKTISITAASTAVLTPFLILGGLSLDDVKLVDGTDFKNQEAYIEHRDTKLAERDSWKMEDFYAKSRELAAIYEYEIKKNKIKFSLAEVLAMRGTDIREKMDNKINKIRTINPISL